jgi:hypothetical protein
MNKQIISMTERRTAFQAPENNYDVFAYHNDKGLPLDHEQLSYSIEHSVGPAMEVAENMAFVERQPPRL